MGAAAIVAGQALIFGYYYATKKKKEENEYVRQECIGIVCDLQGVIMSSWCHHGSCDDTDYDYDNDNILY